jgi:hypothetical protein
VSSSTWRCLQTVLRSEEKRLCGRALILTLFSPCKTFTHILESTVISNSWDCGSSISSFVGSCLIVLIGRGLSGKNVRHGRVAGVMASTLTVGTTSLKADTRLHASWALRLRLFSLLVSETFAMVRGRVVGWRIGVNPSVRRSGARECTSREISRGS